jgi:transcriptional regulator with XRE-family HTH domain
VTPHAIGHALRALRREKGWRQVDLAGRLDITQPIVSAVERGDLDRVSARTLGRLFEACGADLVLFVRWRGGELDRLLDRAHAALVERVVALLTGLGWVVHVEVSFSRFGERGSVDVLGWHPATRAALVVEVKGSINAVEETLRRHDVKVRLGSWIVRNRVGETPSVVGRLLVAPDTSTVRRRIADHAETFARTYPTRGRDVRRWLADPRGPFAGLLLLPDVGSARRQPRARRPHSSLARPASPAGRAPGSAPPAFPADLANPG